MEAVNRNSTMLMEIERELAGPEREMHLARYDAILARLENRIAKALRIGLAPDEFPKVETLREANVTARKILRLTARVGG